MRYLKEFFRFLKHITESKKLILVLAYNDFRQQYLGSYLGVLWAVIRPALYVLVISIVFSTGFRARATRDGTPFLLWLLCGMVPWFFFMEAVTKGMNAIVSNSYLVSKVAFRVSILPLVKILSSLTVHLVLVALLMIVAIVKGYYPSLYWLQLPFYIFFTTIFILGVSWLTSSVKVFVKDVGDIIGVVIQFGFWLTPIFWPLKMIPEPYQLLFKLNPMVYIITGFRDTFINKVWFWEKPWDSLFFFLITMVFLIVGAIVFKRLRPHFGDVL